MGRRSIDSEADSLLSLSDDSDLVSDKGQHLLPPDPDLSEYGRSLGADMKDPDIAWVVQQAFHAPLPASWTEHVDDENRVYYYNYVTCESTWNHPMDSVYRELIALIQKLRRSKPSQEHCAQVLREHLLEVYNRAAGQLGRWSGPYPSEEGDSYYFNEGAQISSWINPMEEFEYEIGIRQAVLYRCILSSTSGQESGTKVEDASPIPALRLPSQAVSHAQEDEDSSARSFHTARESCLSECSALSPALSPTGSESSPSRIRSKVRPARVLTDLAQQVSSMKEDAERGLDDTRTTATTSPKGDHTADPAVSSAASEALKEAQAEELDITFGHTSGMSLPSPLRATSRKAGESRKDQQLGDIQDELEAIESGPSTSAETQAQGNEIKADDDHDGDPVQNTAADEMDITFGRSSLLPKVPARLPGAAAEDFAEAEKPAEQPVEKLEEFAGPASEVLAMQPAGKAKPPKPAAQLEVQAATPSAEQSLQPLEEKTQAVRHLAEKRPAKHLPAGNEPAEQRKDRLAGQPEERPGEQPEQRPIERAKARPAKSRFEADQPRVLPEELKAAEHVAEQPEELPAKRPTEQAEQPEKWPAGKLNDQPAQQPPEQPEDWLAEQPQEQQKERPTEQPEEQTAEQPNNQPTEQPEERQAEEQPAEQPGDQPTEQPEERPEEPAQQLPDDRLPEQPEDERPAKPPEERPAEQPEERLTEQPEEPAEQLEELAEPAEQPEERPTEQPEEPLEEPAEQPEERPTEQPTEQPEEPAEQLEEPAEQPAEQAQPEEPAEQPEERLTEQPQKPAEQLEELAEQPEEPAEQPEERLTEQPQKPAEQLEELAEQSEEPAEQLEEQPTEQREVRTAEQPEERPTEQPEEQPEERSAENAAAHPAEPAVGQLAGLATWKAPCDSEGVSEQASSLTNVEDSELFQEPEELM